MKRIISLILVAVLCIGVLTGCQLVNNLFGKNNGPSVEDAVSVLNDIMKDKNTKPTNDFDLVAQVTAVSENGVKGTFTVEWTCDDETIVIRESTKKNMVTVDIPDTNDTAFEYVLTATISDAEGNKASKSYTYTLPVINNVGITSDLVEGVAYKIFMKQVNFSQKLYLTGEDNEKYLKTTNDPKAAADFYVEKTADGFKFYTMKGDVKTYINAVATPRASDPNKFDKLCLMSAEEGDAFLYNAEINAWYTTINGIKFALGTYGTYDTISISEMSYYTADNTGVEQFPAEFMTKEHAETLAPDEKPVSGDPKPDSTLTIKEALALAATKGSQVYTDGKYYVTGVIDEIYNDQYGNMYIKDAEGNKLTVYGTYDASGNKRFDAMETKPVAGDTITVYGVIGNYNGTYQMKNGWITAINGENLGNGNTDTPANLGIVTNPEVGKAYKFGLHHGNEKATVYFNGQNYNNYAWYLAYAANGVDVYLEAVEGVENAYRLFFYNGEAKTYIVAFPRDGDTTKGTLKLDTTCPTEYFTFNAEYNTLVYTSVTGEQFYLGSSGTYKSISCSAISFITNADSYVSHLYAEDATGEEAPHTHEFVNGKCACGEVDPDYVAPDMPTDGVYTIPQVLAAAEGTEVIVTGTVKGFKYTWDDSWGNCSPYIVDAEGNELLCFRLKTKVAVGDSITVTGTVAVFSGTNQIGEGCTAIINQGGEDSGETTTAVTTIPGALAAADGTDVVINGIVIIAESWNTQFNNMSVTIRDAEGNTLYVYRLATKVGLGDDITITGKVGSYNDAKQIAQGATAVINVVHGDNHTYENGKCTVCDTAEPVAGTKVVECDFSTLAVGTQYADESNTFGDVTVSTHNKGCHFNTQLRIYASDTNNGYAVVKASGVISSLVVNAGYKNSTLEVYGSTDGETWVLIQNVTTTTSYANHTVSIDPSLGYTYLKLDATGNQIRVASLSVTVAQ